MFRLKHRRDVSLFVRLLRFLSVVWSVYFVCLISGGYGQEMSICLRRPGLFCFVRSVGLLFSVRCDCHTLVFVFLAKFNYTDLRRCSNPLYRLHDLRRGPRTYDFGICVRPRPRQRRRLRLYPLFSLFLSYPLPLISFPLFPSLSLFFLLFFSFFSSISFHSLFFPLLFFSLFFPLVSFACYPLLFPLFSLSSLFFFFSFLFFFFSRFVLLSFCSFLLYFCSFLFPFFLSPFFPFLSFPLFTSFLFSSLVFALLCFALFFFLFPLCFVFFCLVLLVAFFFSFGFVFFCSFCLCSVLFCFLLLSPLFCRFWLHISMYVIIISIVVQRWNLAPSMPLH